jgi:predicted nucleic acid-binding protein
VTFLVAANVLSEATKPSPELKVLEWLRANEAGLAVDPIILGEIRFGIDRMPPGQRRKRLDRWFTEGVEKLVCLPIDAATGVRWARLLAKLRASGRAMPLKDSLIAATALVHGLTVATRNTRDFRQAGVKVFDPFASPR